MAGASALLLSFVAAFEHIPEHRRLSLFQSLIDKLGAEDFLFAILAMLTDKFAGNQKVVGFTMELSSQYSTRVQLQASILFMMYLIELIRIQTIGKYFDLVADALKPKRTISERLLNFDVEGSADSVPVNLLLLPSQMLRSPRLISRTAKLLFKKDSNDAEIVRQCYDQILEQVLSIMPRISGSSKCINPNPLTDLRGKC